MADEINAPVVSEPAPAPIPEVATVAVTVEAPAAAPVVAEAAPEAVAEDEAAPAEVEDDGAVELDDLIEQGRNAITALTDFVEALEALRDSA